MAVVVVVVDDATRHDEFSLDRSWALALRNDEDRDEAMELNQQTISKLLLSLTTS